MGVGEVEALKLSVVLEKGQAAAHLSVGEEEAPKLSVVLEKGPNAEDTGNARWKVGWFRFKSKAGWKAKNPFFEQHKIRNQRQTDLLEIASFRLLVDDSATS